MKNILLGIDIGTSACKVAAFTQTGTVIAQANESYEVFYPQQGWAEQDPNDWWEAVCRALQSLLVTVNPSDIAGIGIDGQSWSAIPVDKKGEVLCNTPIWMDTRALDICAEMEAIAGEGVLFGMSKNPVQPMYTMPKVLWYKKNLPEVYKNTDKILQSNSFIAYRLTGALSHERSQGYGWNCYDMQNGVWDTALCEKLGVDASMLPDIFNSHDVVGTVTKKAAEMTGLCEGIPVVAGGLDAACGTRGVGVMSICTAACTADERLILSPHVVPGYYLLQGGTVGGSGTLNWFEREFGEAERQSALESGKSSFAEIDKIAETIFPASDGLVFLPYLAGERSPIWDAKAKGVFFGIEFSKTRAHFARAVMEGVAYSLRHNLETAAEADATVKTLYSMGGAANSRLWTQIKSDVTGLPIQVPSSDTATALGAAILAGVGTGVYKDFEQAVAQTVQVKRTHEPNLQNKAKYDKGYETYIKLYENLKNLMWEV